MFTFTFTFAGTLGKTFARLHVYVCVSIAFARFGIFRQLIDIVVDYLLKVADYLI